MVQAQHTMGKKRFQWRRVPLAPLPLPRSLIKAGEELS